VKELRRVALTLKFVLIRLQSYVQGPSCSQKTQLMLATIRHQKENWLNCSYLEAREKQPWASLSTPSAEKLETSGERDGRKVVIVKLVHKTCIRCFCDDCRLRNHICRKRGKWKHKVAFQTKYNANATPYIVQLHYISAFPKI
jgi:hypothetical protein